MPRDRVLALCGPSWTIPNAHRRPWDGKLMMQDGNLELRLIERTLAGPEQAEDAAQEEIDKRLNHGAALSQDRTP